MTQTPTTWHTGLRGEQIARLVMQGKGFRIEASNWRLGKSGEIDLIAIHPRQKLLVFIEVKTRKGLAYGRPLEAVDQRKMARILALAESYLSLHPPGEDLAIRFDVIGVYFPGAGKAAEVSHIENAFGTDL